MYGRHPGNLRFRKHGVKVEGNHLYGARWLGSAPCAGGERDDGPRGEVDRARAGSEAPPPLGDEDQLDAFGDYRMRGA